MSDILNVPQFTSIKKFYEDHFVKFGKNLSFSVLFLVQPPGGNGLQSISRENFAKPDFRLDATQKKEGLALLTGLCIELYGLLDLSQRKKFSTMLNTLHLDRLLAKEEDKDTIKKDILSAMKAHYEQHNNVLSLDCLLKDFPECKSADGHKSVGEIIIPQKKTLSQVLSSLLEHPGEREQIEKTSKELIGSLVLESSKRNVADFQKDFLLLEAAHAAPSSLKNLALLLLSRYFYDGTHVSDQNDPTWEYLRETYAITADELVTIIQKKHESSYIPFDSIRHLVETYSPAQWDQSVVGKARMKEKFLTSYNDGIHQICIYLNNKLPFLGEDADIKPLLEYIVDTQSVANSTADYNSRKKNTSGKYSRMNSSEGVPGYRQKDRLTNNMAIIKTFVEGVSVDGIRKAAGLIQSLSSDSTLSEKLREYFESLVASPSYSYSLDVMREAISVLKVSPLSANHYHLDDVYENLMKSLLVAGQKDATLIPEINQIIAEGGCPREDVVGYIKELFINSIEVDDIENQEAPFYANDTFAYIGSLHVLEPKEQLENFIRVFVKIYAYALHTSSYYANASLFNGFKTAALERCVGVPQDDVISLLQRYFGSSPEGNLLSSDLFAEMFTKEERQQYFDVYMDSLVAEQNYNDVVALLTCFGESYRHDRKAIMQKMVYVLYDNQRYDTADNIVAKEAISVDLTEEMKELKFSHSLKNKKVTDYIELPDVQTAIVSTPNIKKYVMEEIRRIETHNRRGEEVKFSDLIKVARRIFMGEEVVIDQDVKDLLAKKTLQCFLARSSIAVDESDLYEYLQLNYGDDVEQVNEVNMRKYRRLRSEAAESMTSRINTYGKLIECNKEILQRTEKKRNAATDDEKGARDQKYNERKELLDELPLREYSAILSHLQSSAYAVHRGDSLRKSRNFGQNGYGGYGYQSVGKADDIIYYSKEEIPGAFKELIEEKLPLVLEKDQRRLRISALTSRFGFYEQRKDYEGLEMLERTYGFTIDRQEDQKKALRGFLLNGDKEKIEQITELIALFGMSNAADILYQLYPEYRGLAAEEIQSILSHYLGETLLNYKGIGLHQIPERLDISGVGLLDSLFTVIERDFVREFTEKKKANPEEKNENICQQYLDALQIKFAGVKGNHPKLSEVYEHFSVFIQKVLSVQKPEKFVDHLVEGREFPDFLQKLNAALVTDKKRFLIADGMGLGKSLSAILAKEYAGAASGLVVVPSLVTGTWQGYLSDIDDPATKKRGYYKKGEAPSVFTIESPADIALLKKKSYDYVIISQEKLQGDDYVDALTSQGFDFMIVDEIHKLKNISHGKRATGLLRVTQHIEEHGGSLCLLSGTPIPNKIGDIAILLKLLYPEKYGEMENEDLVFSIIKGGDMLNLRSLLLPMMQMKKLTDHIDMPQLIQSVKHVTLSEKEQLYYDAFVEDNTMTGAEKMMVLRKFLLNPQLVGIHDIEQSSKAKQLGADANKLFETKSKVVFFANGFIDGVLRPKEGVDKTLIEQMNLDPDIQIRVIDGTNTDERQKIQDEFNSSDKKIALFISGSTADVGIDLTAGEHIMHINQPWTQAELDQQEARVYRYGQGKDIETTKYISRGTIEQGIHDYVIMKHNIILKLYYGLKLSELEKKVITEAETEVKKGSSAVNTVLTTFIRSAKDKLNNMFGYLREGGLEKVEALVETRGKEMADYYALLGPRSYQANVNRLHATLISMLMDKEALRDAKIIDLGAGPKMLEQHIDAKLQHSVTSIDINPNHFAQDDIASGRAVVANFGKLPYKDNEIDVVSSSLSFNETARSRSQENYERLDVLLEMHRVLKPGGIAVISTIYSLQYKYPEHLGVLLKDIGFEIVPAYSGKVTGDKASLFETKTLVLKKIDMTQQLRWMRPERRKEELIKSKNIKGLDMVKDPVTLSSQEYVLENIEFIPMSVKEETSRAPIKLSASGKTIKDTERAYKNLVGEMQLADGVKHIADITENTLRKRGFGRYMNPSSCVIVVRLPNNAGLFRYSMPLKKD